LETYGVFALLPSLVALLHFFLTKKVIASLFYDVLVGGLMIYHGNIFAAVAQSWLELVFPAVDG
jgi:Na+/H+ antiporter NhaC